MNLSEAGRATLMIVSEDPDNTRLLAIAANAGGWRTVALARSLQAALELLDVGGVDRVLTSMQFWDNRRGGVRIVTEALNKGIPAEDIMIFSGTDPVDVLGVAPLIKKGVAYMVKPRGLPEAFRFVSLGMMTVG